MSDHQPVLQALAAPVPRTETLLRPSLGAYLGFAWFGLMAVLSTLVVAPAQILAHRQSPSARTFSRWAGRWGRWALRPSGVRLEVEDHARLAPEQPCIFVANHQNALDILALSAAVPYPYGFVAKAELERTPVLGMAIRHSACVFVDKRDPRTAVKSMQEAGERIRAGNSVMIFPEGERSYSGGLLPFQRGAFFLAVEAGVPLVPVSLLGAYRLLDERRYLFRPGTVRVVLHPPIPMEGVTRRELPDITARVRETLDASLAAYERAYPVAR